MKNLITYESFSHEETLGSLNEFYGVKMDDGGIDPNKWTAEINIPEITVYSSDYDSVLEKLEEVHHIPMEFTFDRICHEIASYIDSYMDSILDQAGENERDFVYAWNSMDEDEKDKWYKRCEGRNPILKKLSFAKRKVI